MSMRTFLLTALLTITGATVAVAQVGITAVPFLQIEPDSRAAGMGNTGVAVADNASALFWNPAGFAFQNTESQISATRSEWLPNFNTDLTYYYLAGKYHINGLGNFGAHITYFDLGEQVQTDEIGNELGTFRSYELASGISHGIRINNNFAMGVGFRFIYSRLAPAGISVGGQTAQNGASVGFDVAGLYRTNPFSIGDRDARFSAGFNLSNLGRGMQYVDDAQRDPLPTMIRAGWALNMSLDAEGYNTLTIANDISKVMARNDSTGRAMPFMQALVRSWDTYQRFDALTNETVDVPLVEQLMIGIGAEYWYNNMFALRGGYFYESPNNGDRQFITIGAGIRYNIFGVDFSYLQTLKENHPLANTIRFSLLLNF